LKTVWFAFVAALIPLHACIAQSRLPPGPLEIAPLPGETATARAGGPTGVFVSKEALRCARPDEAIVGFRTRRGSVLDYLQIVCAQVQCRGSDCGWTRSLSTGSVGDPNGGQIAALLLCDRTEVVSGFRAKLKGLGEIQYVEDISAQCAAIAGPPTAGNAVPIDGEDKRPRRWIHATGHLASPQVEGICPATGTTGVAAFGGRWMLRATVAQAMALLCGASGAGTCPSGSHADFRDVLGATGCKPCLTLQGSANAVTGRTDREVANLPNARYNCHFYTLSYMNYVTPPVDKGRAPRRFGRLPGIDFETGSTRLTDEDIQTRYGWMPVRGPLPASLRPGDVVTVPDEASSSGSVHHNVHSGIVIRSGAQVLIRQKPNPVNCVVDLTWNEFVTFYRAQHGVNAWRLQK